MIRLNKGRRQRGGGKKPPYPYIKISEEQRDDAYENLKNYDCPNELSLSTIGNRASNYYFQPYRERTKVGKWSHYSAWMDDEKRKKIIDVDKRINRNSPKIIGTPAGLQSAMRMNIGSINQFKPYVAVCGVYKKFKPKRVLDTSAGWGDRLIGAMTQNIDYIGIDQNKKLITPYKRMIKDFEDKSTSNVIMIFEKSQNVDYSKLPKYDLIFTSPPYFDLEKYEGMEIFKDKEEFLEKYWRPTIKKAYKYLEKGGHVALNMPEEMYTALKPVIGTADIKIKMPIQNRFNWRGGAPKFEYIYVWKKI
jgi:16S rRNA G966 N2-methylase RsmD